MPVERDPILRRIGLRVVRHREALGLTQKELADRIGITAGNISPIEHGERNLTIETVCKLAEALETTFLDLVGAEQPGEGRERKG